MTDPTMLWNGILSLAIGGFLWWIRGVSIQINEVKQKMSDTREHIAERYAAKEDVAKDMEQLLVRFDRLEDKLDNIFTKLPKS